MVANSYAQYIRWHFLEAWLYYLEIPQHTQTRRSAITRYRPWRSRGARVNSCSANGPRGCRIFAKYCCSVHVSARGQIRGLPRDNIWRRNTMSRYQPEIGTKHPFQWNFRSWKLSEPTFVSTRRVHRSYCRRILYKSRSMACIGEP